MKTTGTDRAPRRNRWAWALTLLLGIVGAAAALVRNRRAAPAAGQFVARPEQVMWRSPDEVATGHSPMGNGVVRAQQRRGDDG